MVKKFLFALLFLCAIFSITGLVLAAESPYRYATSVDDVFEPYQADEWIISPDEEAIGDQEVDNAPECDIKAAIACYDPDYLRVDILLNNNVSFKWDTFFGVRLEYASFSEYYTYYILTKKLIYQKERDGKIVDTKDLTQSSAGDTAGITNWGELSNSDIYIIINKSKHIGGEKGKNYYLNTYFYSGFYDNSDTRKIADDTVDINLDFEY